MSASRRSGTANESVPDKPGQDERDEPEPERDGPGREKRDEQDERNENGRRRRDGRDGDGTDLLAALLDGMDAALCAFDAQGVVTHWNREAERILGWTTAEAVGRKGLSGWAVRPEDAAEVEGRLMSVMRAAIRQVHEFALLTKDGRRVLVRTQCAVVPGPDGRPAGLYCAFSEVHAQMDLERSIALSEALFEDASWGVVLVDADLRPAVVNAYAADALGSRRTAALGRPLGDLLGPGVEDLEAALTHVLAEGAPPAPAEMWVTVRTPDGDRRRCWRCGFLRLASPLAEEPVPLGVGWFFQDVTESRQGEQESALLRFRANQLHRASRVAAECEDPAEAATLHLDFALAGFADHALLDRVAVRPGRPGRPERPERPERSGQPGQPGQPARPGPGQPGRSDAGAGNGRGDGPGAGSGVGSGAGSADSEAGPGTGQGSGTGQGGSDVGAGTGAGTWSGAGTGTGAGADSGAGAGTGAGTWAGADTGAGAGAGAGAGVEAGAGIGAGSGVGIGADAGLEPAPEPAPEPVRLVRVAATPAGSPGPSEFAGQAGLPVRYEAGHPAVRAVERCGPVRASAGAADAEQARRWALARQWPPDAVHALCAVLRSRGRTLGVVTFLRAAGRGPFERTDAVYAEDVAVRMAAALDLAEGAGR